MSSMTKSVDRAGEQVMHSASHVRANIVELATQALRLVNGFREAEERGIVSLLSRVGLQRRQSAARPILWFAAGAVAAGATALFLTPMKGDNLFRRVIKAVQGAAHDVESAVKHAGAEANGVVDGAGADGRATQHQS